MKGGTNEVIFGESVWKKRGGKKNPRRPRREDDSKGAYKPLR